MDLCSYWEDHISVSVVESRLLNDHLPTVAGALAKALQFGIWQSFGHSLECFAGFRDPFLLGITLHQLPSVDLGGPARELLFTGHRELIPRIQHLAAGHTSFVATFSPLHNQLSATDLPSVSQHVLSFSVGEGVDPRAGHSRQS